MGSFEFAFGRCTMSDGLLTINRSDPESMGRLKVLRTGFAASWKHQPGQTALWLGRTALLGLLFVILVGYLYTAYSVEPPLVVSLSILGMLAIIGPLEVNYRRAARERRRIQRRLADQRRLTWPGQLRLDDITGVKVQPVSTGANLVDGQILLIQYNESGEQATTYLGFPKFMGDELETAQSLFEKHGLTIKGTTHDKEKLCTL